MSEGCPDDDDVPEPPPEPLFEEVSRTIESVTVQLPERRKRRVTIGRISELRMRDPDTGVIYTFRL